MPQAINEDNLGAWLIKCDPEAKFDLARARAEGMTHIYDWSVVPGYRADLMTPNDKIFLWVSGNGRRMARGIWGVGRVTGAVEPNSRDAYFSDLGYWLDRSAREAVQLFVPVDIELFDDPIAAEELVSTGIDDLEVQRMPGGSNPSWISRDQLHRLESLLPQEWPDEVPDQTPISVTANGAGFGSPAKNAIVEAIAMAEVVDHYGSGWRWDDVSLQNLGWDITFTNKKTGEVARVEVKGVSGPSPIVLLTANEVRAAENRPGWRLAVVTSALSSPKVGVYAADEALNQAKPHVFKADLRS